MAEVTVKELAKTVGASVDRLLMQMKEAGLNHSSADATVSDEEKQILLGYLKGLHGEKSGEPKKIVLRRKTVSTLKSGNRKTVNIEVRKKRTYVKRDDLDEAVAAGGAAELAPTDVASVDAGLNAEAADGSGIDAEAAGSAVAAAAQDQGSDSNADHLLPEEESGDLDPEVLRQRAAARRKIEEEQRQKALEAAAEERRQEEQHGLLQLDGLDVLGCSREGINTGRPCR